MYIEGTLAVVIPHSFTNDKGEEIMWFTNVLYSREADGTTEKFEFNSKENYRDAEGKTGIFKLTARKARQVFDREGGPADNVYKLSIVGFQEK